MGEIVAKQIPEQELIPIERQIAASPKGVSISELEAGLASMGYIINRRTLLRRLIILAEQNRIIASGVLKGRIYRPPQALVAEAANDESLIPLSDAGNEIRRYVVSRQDTTAIFSFPIPKTDHTWMMPRESTCI
jgi:hypothetical protein